MLIKYKLVVSAVTAFVLIFAQSASALTPPNPNERLPFLRLYNSLTNDHFYTTDRAEAQNAQLFHGYKLEGELGYVEKTQRMGTLNIIRMWNPATGKHFYTTSDAEASQAQSSGFVKEGVIGYLLHDTPPQNAPAGDSPPLEDIPVTLAVYRLYNPIHRKHFYTISRAEMLQVQVMGYRLEGDLGTLFEKQEGY